METHRTSGEISCQDGRQFAVSERTIPVDIISKVTVEQPKEVSEKRRKQTQKVSLRWKRNCSF